MDRAQRHANEILTQIVQFRFRAFRTRHADLHDRHVGRVEAHHEGRGDTGRHVARHALRRGGELRHPGIHIGVRLEEHLHDAQPIQRLRFDVLDVVDVARVHALGRADDALFHLSR